MNFRRLPSLIRIMLARLMLRLACFTMRKAALTAPWIDERV